MSRGVVLWPDTDTAAQVRRIWDELATRGLPSLATHTHRLHQPHCSLMVAEDVPVDPGLAATGVVPSRPILLRIESVGVFPDMGTLFLAPIVTQHLLAEQRRVHAAVAPWAQEPWPYFEPDVWVPHLTVAWSLTAAELANAIPLVLARLPITGMFDHGGLEDGTTGQNWPATPPT